MFHTHIFLYRHDLEMMRKMKEDEKNRDKDRLKAERVEL